MANTAILEQQAFPVLGSAQIARLRAFGTVKATTAGEVLFDIGDPDYGLVVVLDGETAVVDRANRDKVLKTSGPGEFNGELGLLNGQGAFAACIIRKSGKVLLVPRAAVNEIIATIPVLSELLVTAFAARRQLLMQSAVGSLTIIGRDEEPDVLRLLEFADRNRIPYRWLNPDNPENRPAIAECGSPESAGFRAVLAGQRTLERPRPLDLARVVGLDLRYRQDAPSDLIIIGAGPGGLAAAVYGASEGLSTLVVEDTAIGGQAGTSSCIENYVGFPAGIAGDELAFMAEVQAIKFGARLTIPRRAVALDRQEDFVRRPARSRRRSRRPERCYCHRRPLSAVEFVWAGPFRRHRDLLCGNRARSPTLPRPGGRRGRGRQLGRASGHVSVTARQSRVPAVPGSRSSAEHV